MVMNPRHIPECIRSIGSLMVDQAWLSFYPENELPINDVVASTSYDRYTLVSDDTVVPQTALDAVLEAHDEYPDAVVTGYSRLAEDDERVNLVSEPLRSREPGVDAYSLMTQEMVDAMPPVFETWFAGYSLTTASRDAWLECPHPGRGNANDFYQSQLFVDSGRRILAARDGKIEHVKERWNQPDQDPRKALFVGVLPREVRMVTQ